MTTAPTFVTLQELQGYHHIFKKTPLKTREKKLYIIEKGFSP